MDILFDPRKYKNLKASSRLRSGGAFRPTRAVSLDTIFLGFACSYRGSFFSTYCPGNNIKYQQQSARSIGKQIKNVKLVAGGYSETTGCDLAATVASNKCRSFRLNYLTNYSEFVKIGGGRRIRCRC